MASRATYYNGEEGNLAGRPISTSDIPVREKLEGNGSGVQPLVVMFKCGILNLFFVATFLSGSATDFGKLPKAAPRKKQRRCAPSHSSSPEVSEDEASGDQASEHEASGDETDSENEASGAEFGALVVQPSNTGLATCYAATLEQLLDKFQEQDGKDEKPFCPGEVAITLPLVHKCTGSGVYFKGCEKRFPSGRTKTGYVVIQQLEGGEGGDIIGTGPWKFGVVRYDLTTMGKPGTTLKDLLGVAMRIFRAEDTPQDVQDISLVKVPGYNSDVTPGAYDRLMLAESREVKKQRYGVIATHKKFADEARSLGFVKSVKLLEDFIESMEETYDNTAAATAFRLFAIFYGNAIEKLLIGIRSENKDKSNMARKVMENLYSAFLEIEAVPNEAGYEDFLTYAQETAWRKLEQGNNAHRLPTCESFRVRSLTDSRMMAMCLSHLKEAVTRHETLLMIHKNAAAATTVVRTRVDEDGEFEEEIDLPKVAEELQKQEVEQEEVEQEKEDSSIALARLSREFAENYNPPPTEGEFYRAAAEEALKKLVESSQYPTLTWEFLREPLPGLSVDYTAVLISPLERRHTEHLAALELQQQQEAEEQSRLAITRATSKATKTVRRKRKRNELEDLKSSVTYN